MKYHVQRTDKASDQLDNLIQYIADDSGDIDLALHYLDRIEALEERVAELESEQGANELHAPSVSESQADGSSQAVSSVQVA